MKTRWLRKNGFPCVLSVCETHFLTIAKLGFTPPVAGYGGGPPPRMCDCCPGHEYHYLITPCPTCLGSGLAHYDPPQGHPLRRADG